jgi:tryptophan synthase beta chain
MSLPALVEVMLPTYYHFLDDEDVKIIAVEAAGLGVDWRKCSYSVLGKGVIHGSKTLLMQSTDGQITEPYSISAGLDSQALVLCTLIFMQRKSTVYLDTDEQAMQWGLKLSKMEGLIPAIESAFALDEMKFKPEDIVD